MTMNRVKNWLVHGLWLAVAMCAGWWLHGNRVVAAQNAEPQFQWQSLGADAALSVYYPSDRVLYVYRGATTGNARVNCAFQYKVSRPGDPLERTNCAIGKAY
jgi:hypothetical protein